MRIMPLPFLLATTLSLSGIAAVAEEEAPATPRR